MANLHQYVSRAANIRVRWEYKGERIKINMDLSCEKDFAEGLFFEVIGKDSSVHKTVWETCAANGSTIFIMYSFLGKVQACISKLLAAFAPISKWFPRG